MRPLSDEKRQRIVEVAGEAFAGRRYDEVTLDGIATSAQVSKGTIYTYFADKEQLYRGVLQSALDSLWDGIRGQVAVANTPVDKLRAALIAIYSYLRGHPHVARLMHTEEYREWSEECRKVVTAQRARVAGLVAETLREGVRRREFRIDRPDWAARALLGMSRSVYLYAPTEDTCEDMADAVVHLFLYGVLDRTAAAAVGSATQAIPVFEA